MLNKIENIKDTVTSILKEDARTRDNDNLLMLKVWTLQNPRLTDNSYSFFEWGKDFMQGKYSSPESIRRTRQLIQASTASLRGYNASVNKAHAEDMREALRQ